MQLIHHSQLRILLLPALLLCGAIDLVAAADHAKLNIHQIRNWYAQGDSKLIIENNRKQRYQVDFLVPCHGLNAAETLAFISRGGRSLDRDSSVILPDGSRCPFAVFAQIPHIAPTTIPSEPLQKISPQ